MKTWHVVLLSVAMVTGGLIASKGTAQTATGDWGMATGPAAFLYNSSTRQVFICEYRSGLQPTCQEVKTFL